MDLYLELLYINGEINLVIHIKNNEYHFTIKYDIKECAFEFEIIDWTKGKERKQKTLNVSVKNQGDVDNFIIAFNIYLLSIQYFDYGNLNLYKKKVKRLTGIESA